MTSRHGRRGLPRVGYRRRSLTRACRKKLVSVEKDRARRSLARAGRKKLVSVEKDRAWSDLSVIYNRLLNISALYIYM